MIEIKIIPNNDIGETAINIHMESSNKLNFRERLIFKTSGYKQTVYPDKSLVLEIKNSLVNNPAFLDLIKQQIINALKSNGAELDIDYKMEVV